MSNPLNMSPIDWYNFYGDFTKIFDGLRVNFITPTECAIISDDPNKTTFIHNGTTIQVVRSNKYYPIGVVSKFMLFSAIQFKYNDTQACSFIQHELMGIKLPYIRVKCDYYKIIQKEDRYTGVQTNLIPWKKDEIKQDNPKNVLSIIPKFDDYVIVPDNKNYQPVIKNCYNMYSRFPHKPFNGQVTERDIPVTWNFINHIFTAGTPNRPQIESGLKYLKVLYEHPKQILPILCLISKERNTGKTTFNNWMQMLFGDNYTSISPEALTKNFNSNYATKNIISFEEAFVEKQQGIEKLKHLSTGKYIDVSQKFISEYSIPFFGKFILFSNKVLDFMRIDFEENRFWIRLIPVIQGKRNVLIEDQLFQEIPKFLKYLEQLPDIIFDNGYRMVLTEEETYTDALMAVKEQSKSGLLKELEILIDDYFNNTGSLEFFATPTDIKQRWFINNNTISINYLRNIIKEEMGLIPMDYHRYYPFEEADYAKSKPGTPFKFININPKPIPLYPETNGIVNSVVDVPF